jgi:hypothetical protein
LEPDEHAEPAATASAAIRSREAARISAFQNAGRLLNVA